MDGALERLAQVLRGKRITVLTGAGCSTESGIPDYRGPDTPPRVRASIQHREFIEKPEYRQRYWARSLLGWPRLRSAKPNEAHLALVELQRAGIAAGLITQNVDGLHSAAGHADVVELHGALARVKCLACGEMTSRDELQEALRVANPRFAETLEVKMTPDGDAELADDLVEDFQLVPCTACGGVMMPDVVFFGGSVPKPTLAAAWSAFDAGEALLVVGSSLTVFSGYRFVRRAAERGIPIAILNRGPTRGDEHATVRCDARAGQALPALVRALA
ncbi:MAG TPA: NAD-dependent protein deacetylase [Kofleriaceae bacterium]